MVGDDLICPITLELPFDPVTADDGFVYERSAIEAHIARQTTAAPSAYPPHLFAPAFPAPALLSPMSNEPMGPRLLPSVQIKNLIATLITNRSITGDLAEAWKRKNAEKESAERWLTAAQNGDADAMFKVYKGSRHGQNGFKQNLGLALNWLQAAYNAGSKEAIGDWGLALLRGCLETIHISPSPQHGLVLTALAATRGNCDCAFVLGKAYARGHFGLRVDNIQANIWLQNALDNDCDMHPMPENKSQKAR